LKHVLRSGSFGSIIELLICVRRPFFLIRKPFSEIFLVSPKLSSPTLACNTLPVGKQRKNLLKSYCCCCCCFDADAFVDVDDVAVIVVVVAADVVAAVAVAVVAVVAEVGFLRTYPRQML
jgi:hypothetical protein